MTRRSPLRALLALAVALAALGPLAGAAAALEASSECQPVIDDLGAALRDLPNAGAQPGSRAQQERLEQGSSLFDQASDRNPECASDIEAFGLELAAESRRAVITGTPFWGPVGWLWNNVYYRVFNGNDVMMALFGWALLLSPVILGVSAYWVLRGSRGAFHRPFVPEHLRTDG
jgi:hypothetical protein